jgi:hypothetical protein
MQTFASENNSKFLVDLLTATEAATLRWKVRVLVWKHRRIQNFPARPTLQRMFLFMLFVQQCVCVCQLVNGTLFVII